MKTSEMTNEDLLQVIQKAHNRMNGMEHKPLARDPMDYMDAVQELHHRGFVVDFVSTAVLVPCPRSSQNHT